MKLRGQGRIYPRGARFWIEFWYRGEQFRESGGVTEAKARQKLKARLKELAADTFVGVGEERVTVEELIADLLAHLQLQGKKSVPQFTSHLKPVRDFFLRHRALEVTSESIERYQAERRAEGKKPATVNREVGALKQAFYLARKRRRLSRLPYFPMLTEDNARSGFFERPEFEAVCANLPAHVADVARFAYGSGWRKGEILPLTWENVDRTGQEARLRTSKNGQPRTLPLTGELSRLIERRWDLREFEREDKTTGISQYVFHAGDGRAVVDFKRSWASACTAAGVTGMLFHDLRRSAVRDMIRSGVPQSVAMRISGHKTAAVFTRYDITSDADKREALILTEKYRETRTNATILPMQNAAK